MHRTSAGMTEIAQCTTRFLIKKKLHILETLFYKSQRGKKTHVIYEEIHFFPWLPISFLTRFLITSYSPWPNKIEFLQPWILFCPGHYDAFTLTPCQYKDKSSELRTPQLSRISSLFTSSSVQFRNRAVVLRVTTEKCSESWASLFLSVRREENGAIEGRKISYTRKGICRDLESLQAMTGCLQSWRPWEWRGGED